MAGVLVNFFFQRCQFLAEIAAHLFKDRRIDLDAGQLHLADDRDQRSFDVFINRHHAFLREAWLKNFMQPQRNLGILSGIIARLVQRHVIECYLVLTLARDFLIFDCRMAAEQFG